MLLLKFCPLVIPLFKYNRIYSVDVCRNIFTFIPIFSTAFILLKKDGYAMNFKTIQSALYLHKLSKKDYLWIVIGLIIAGLLCCITFAWK